MSRRVIVHYHIFKNAGTTVATIFHRMLGPEFVGGIEGQYAWSTVTNDELTQYIQGHPELRFVTSHLARLPTPEIDGVEIYPVLFLRDPIDRVGSVYEFQRRQPASDGALGVAVAREHGLADYVRWRLTDGNGSVIRNFQVIHMSGRLTDMRTASATEDDFELARARLSALGFFGLVEHFDNSLSRMANYLRPAIGSHLNIDYEILNRNPDRKTTLQERLADIRAELGNTLYQELVEKNEKDLRLYAAAQILFGSAD